MNVGDVVNRVKRVFGDEAGVQITDDDMFRWINDAQLQISIENSGLIEAIATSDIVSGQAEYDLPPNTNVLRSLMYDGFRIKPLSFSEFNEYLDGFSSPDSPYGNGRPDVFMIWQEKITLFPKPGENLTGGLKVYYSKHPDKISTLADALTVPLKYHNAIVSYCLEQAYELDEDTEKLAMSKGKFDSTVMKLSDQEKWTSQEYYPRITTLPDDEEFGGYGIWGGFV